jgi:hypothetical protein
LTREWTFPNVSSIHTSPLLPSGTSSSVILSLSLSCREIPIFFDFTDRQPIDRHTKVTVSHKKTKSRTDLPFQLWNARVAMLNTTKNT